MKEEEQLALEQEEKEAEKERLEKEEEAKKEEERKAEEERQAELEAKTVTLGNGNYIAGEDFESGTYDIVAISGGGNVYSSNMYSGGLNAIMGIANDGFYQKKYKNISLPSGTKLTIDGVKVKLVPRD